jgi:hypothetical protein
MGVIYPLRCHSERSEESAVSLSPHIPHCVRDEGALLHLSRQRESCPQGTRKDRAPPHKTLMKAIVAVRDDFHRSITLVWVITMNAYSISLALGAVGFTVMAVSGLSRHSHGGSGNGANVIPSEALRR